MNSTVSRTFAALLAALPFLTGCKTAAPLLPPIVVAPSPDPSSSSMSGRTHFLMARFGPRSLEQEDDYMPAEDPLTLGFQYAKRFGRSPIGMESGFSVSYDGSSDRVGASDVDTHNAFVEGTLGLRAMLDLGPVQMFAGGGGAFAYAEVDQEVDSVSMVNEHDTSAGAYAHAGILWSVYASLIVGFEARVLRGTEIEFDGLPDSDMDYAEVTVLIGWSPLRRSR